MKLKYLLVLGLLAIGCKNGEALSPATANNPPPVVVVSTPSPTFAQCAASGWDWSKETASDAYQAGMKAYQEWKATHPDTEEKTDTAEN